MQRKNIKNNKPDSEPCVWGSKCLIAGDVTFPSVQRKRRGKGGMTEVKQYKLSGGVGPCLPSVDGRVTCHNRRAPDDHRCLLYHTVIHTY